MMESTEFDVKVSRKFMRGLINGILLSSLIWGILFVIVVVTHTIFWKG